MEIFLKNISFICYFIISKKHLFFRTDLKSHYAIELTEKKQTRSNANDAQKEDYDPYKNRQVEYPTT